MAFGDTERRAGWTADVEKRLSWPAAILVISACSIVGWAVLIPTVVALWRLSRYL
jgi:hypothetical protein